MSVRHVMLECVSYGRERERMYQRLSELGVESGMNGMLSEEGFAVFREFAR